jgi:hypothetical protein
LTLLLQHWSTERAPNKPPMTMPLVTFAAQHKELIRAWRSNLPGLNDEEINTLLQREGVRDHHITKSYFRAPLRLFPHFLPQEFDSKDWIQYLRNPASFIFKCLQCDDHFFKVIDHRVINHWANSHSAQLANLSIENERKITQLRQKVFPCKSPAEAVWSIFVQKVELVHTSTDPFVVANPDRLSLAQAPRPLPFAAATATPVAKSSSHKAAKQKHQAAASSQVPGVSKQARTNIQHVESSTSTLQPPSAPSVQQTPADMAEIRPPKPDDKEAAEKQVSYPHNTLSITMPSRLT